MDGFASIASPLTTLTQKSMKFELSEACERSFQILKDRLTFFMVFTFVGGYKGFLCVLLRFPSGFGFHPYETWEGSSLCV